MALTTRPKQVAEDHNTQEGEATATPSKGGFFARKKAEKPEKASTPDQAAPKKAWGLFSREKKAKPEASTPTNSAKKSFFRKSHTSEVASEASPKKGASFMRPTQPSVLPNDVPSEEVVENVVSLEHPVVEVPVEAVTPEMEDRPFVEPRFQEEGPAPIFAQEKPFPEAATPSAKKGLFSKADKKKAVKGKPVKQGGTKVSGVSEAYVVVPLRETTFWKITEGDLQPVGPEAAPSYVSFSGNERRFVSDKNLTYKEANERAMLETAQMVRLINHTQESKIFYTVEVGGVDPLPYRISSGHLALDRLLAKHGKLHLKGTPLISGFVLTDQDNANTLLVLYHVDSQGDIGQPEVSMNPRSLDFAISQFVAQRKINRKETEITLFNNKDFLSIAGNLPLFPNEAMVGGVPLRKIVNYMMTASAVAMLGSFGWTATMFTAKKVAEHRNAEVQKEVKAKGEINSQLLSKSVRSFAQTMTLNAPDAFKQAEALWREDYKITLEAVPGVNKFRVSMPLTVNRLFNGKPAASAIRSPLEVESMLKYKVPEGCVRSDLFISGGMNEIQFTVDCQTADSGLSRFGND